MIKKLCFGLFFVITSCSLQDLKECDPGMLYCNGECVESSVTHCGSCNNVCASDRSCLDGVCVLQCKLGEELCHNRCLDRDSLRIESCEENKLRCKEGYGNCDDDVINGCETDLNSDRKHCGRCGKACRGELLCKNGDCDEKCDGEYRRCDTRCISGNQCCYASECGVREHATAQCTAQNECLWKCDTGYKPCGDLCIPDDGCCDASQCKAIEGKTATCADRQCVYKCNEGTKPCGDGCIDNADCCEDKECPAPGNGRGVCEDRKCKKVCAESDRLCESKNICMPKSNCCVDTDCEVKEHRIAQCNDTHQCVWHCVSGYKTCGDGCIPDNRCCKDDDCYQIANGKVLCVNHSCEKSCNPGYKLCKNGTCIQGGAQACCGDEDCQERQLCDKATNRCIQGVQCENAMFYCYEPCQCIEDKCKHATQSTYKCQKRLY